MSWQGSCEHEVGKTKPRDSAIANYLLIELANIVVGLPLSLNIHGVVLNTFGCGHDKPATTNSKKDRYRQNPQPTQNQEERTYRVKNVRLVGLGRRGGGG